MTDWTAVALRFAIYLDLMLLFGLAAYDLYAARPTRAARPILLGALAALGLALGVAGFLVTTASMAGLAIGDLDRETVRMVLVETPVGVAAILRIAALAVTALAVASRNPSSGHRWAAATASAIALATLAWSGHGAMDKGAVGAVHLIADIIHLLAAAAWLGALAILLVMASHPLAGVEAVGAARDALAGFSSAGSVIVALVLVSGVVNGWIILGPANLPLLPFSLYGQLLIAKLALFMAMLGFAGANRWRLTPRLEVSLVGGDLPSAARALRTSISLEAGAAITIIGLVAWLGTLAPPDVAM